MFGFIYSLFMTVGIVMNKNSKHKENEENKIKYRNPDGLTYVDINGQSRLIVNDELVFYVWQNGDYVLKNIHGHIYKNFSQEKRIKQIKENEQIALRNNESTYCIDENIHDKNWTKKGKRFKDFKTGDVYIIRYINYKYYYMRLSDAMLIRKTDWQIAYDEKRKDDKFWFKDIDIEAFNKKQKTITDEYALYREWEYNSSCNVYK